MLPKVGLNQPIVNNGYIYSEQQRYLRIQF